MKKPLIIVAGPTACGKTDTGIYLAEKLNTEIISADSMQIYKHMDIGTAKPRKEEMRGIRHHLIDELEPDCNYSVSAFKSMAVDRINKLHENGKIPIIVGGTGFYINSVIYNNDFEHIQTDNSYRKELREIADSKGSLYLYEMLVRIDPASAEKIHPNNTKRVMRAIEYYNQTGTPISSHNEREKRREPYYNVCLIILYMDRRLLYERINKRVDNMIEAGLVCEVKFLYERYGSNLTSMQGLGYKELIPSLKGERALEESIEILKRDTRHFAKRQLTWFKHQCEGVWLDVTEFKSQDVLSEQIMKISEGKKVGFY